MSSRQQCAVLNGETSHFVEVTSGVPQGSVLWPILFLIFIIDIHIDVTPLSALFTDDCAVHRCISNEEGSGQLQADLGKIVHWSSKWKMQLNVKKIEKSVHGSFTCKKKIMQTEYCLSNELVENENKVQYLGIILSSDGIWGVQIGDVTAKAGRPLAPRHCSTKPEAGHAEK